MFPFCYCILGTLVVGDVERLATKSLKYQTLLSSILDRAGAYRRATFTRCLPDGFLDKQHTRSRHGLRSWRAKGLV